MFTSIKLNISIDKYVAWESAQLACGLAEIYLGVDLVDCYSYAVRHGVIFS
jgi:hypothetical protein